MALLSNSIRHGTCIILVGYLRHPGIHPRGRRGRLNQPLQDMTAEAQWYEKLLKFGRYQLKINWGTFRKQIIQYLGGGQKGMDEFDKCFMVRFG